MSQLYQTTYLSPIGQITLAAHDTALVGLWFEGQKYFAQTLQSQTPIHRTNLILNQTKNWLDSYFQNQNPNPHSIPLDPQGTAFQLLVWQILRTIPYGQTTTYGTVARQIASKLNQTKMSAQAVGGAIGRNPISILIPCHRVVSANGNLTGYAGGIDKKRYLYQLENISLHKYNKTQISGFIHN